MKKFWIPIVAFALLGVLLWRGLSLDPRKLPSPLIDKPLPAFDLPTLHDPSKRLRNADFHGQVVLINIWASWCAACKVEHPALLAFARTKQVPLIGLNYKDARADALKVLQDDGDPYRVSLADTSGRTGIDWGVYGVPETFLIDRQGVVRYKHVGPVTTEILANDFMPRVRALNADAPKSAP